MRSGTALAIETTGLIKRSAPTPPSTASTLAVPTGGVYGVLGPNGAGKTTTIRMLATLLPIDGGSARVLGHDVAKEAETVRARCPLTGQFASLDEDLTGTRISCCWAGCTGTRGPRPAPAAANSSTRSDSRRPAAVRSRPIRVACAGASTRCQHHRDPRLISPRRTDDRLDPRSRNQVWEIVRALVAGGTTVLLHHPVPGRGGPAGRPDRRDRPRQGHRRGHHRPAQGSVGSGALHVRVAEPSRRADAAVTLERTHRRARQPRIRSRRADGTHRRTRSGWARALAALDDENLAVTTFALGQPSLDEVFLALTGHGAETTTDSDTLEGTAS